MFMLVRVLCRYVESATTTGATSRSFTSTAATVSTKTLRQLERMERNPKAKVRGTLS